jgi:hypothetical protein
MSVVASNQNSASFDTTVSAAVTPSGSNRLLLAFIYFEGTTDPSSITAGGSPMTLIGNQNDQSSDGRTGWYYLIAPATSSTTVTVTWAGTHNFLILGVLALDDAHQTTPIRAGSFNSTDAADGATGNIAITNTSGDLVIAGIGAYADSNPITPNNTEVLEYDPFGGGNSIGIQRAAGAGSGITVSWAAMSGPSPVAGFAVAPAGGGAASVSRMMLLGVG